MAENEITEFENKCMDLIEQIVSIDIRQNRQGAIAVSKKMLTKAQEKTKNKKVLDIYARVVKEFELASDEEYEMLRKQIFKA